MITKPKKQWSAAAVVFSDGSAGWEIAPTRGQVAIIDAPDLPLVADYTWNAQVRRDGKGFYVRSSEGVRMHRLLMGVTDPKVIVDHEDGDGLNNRRGNIRVGTQSLNCVNRQTTPGQYLRGVCPAKRGKPWRAYIKHSGRQRSLGQYDTPEEAHQVYLAEAARVHGAAWLPTHHRPDHQAGAIRASGGKR